MWLIAIKAVTPFVKPTSFGDMFRLEDNIKMNLKEIRQSVDWFNMLQDRDQWRGFLNYIF
jgi:hypothetical protein